MRAFVEYKGIDIKEEVEVLTVNPAYNSQVCPNCRSSVRKELKEI